MRLRYTFLVQSIIYDIISEHFQRIQNVQNLLETDTEKNELPLCYIYSGKYQLA